MNEHFEAILRDGSEEFAARISPRPSESVRARGDELRRRRSAATAALAVTLVTAVGAGAWAVTGFSPQASPPESVGGAAMPTTSTAPPTRPPKTPSTVPDTVPPHQSSPSAACRSLVVPQEVKDSVTLAYRRSQPGLVHIIPVKGTFYYGECDGVSYAAAAFTPTPGATEDELVRMQDEGAAEKYFSKAPSGEWTYVASDGLPRSPRGCAAITEIPAGLAAVWGGCLAKP